MSVIRLEFTVAADDAATVTAELMRSYRAVIGDVPHGHVVIEVRSDEAALMERLALERTSRRA